ncbi:MAG: MBL fold metallo-hydrolase [Deltaproteobacteria bacterium]|nr:MBL fold metallo-hydrolase [Deltaproteobacteria bacterium]
MSPSPLAFLLQSAARALGGTRLLIDEPVSGITRLRLSSRTTRFNGMETAAYLVGPVLVDTGFVHAAAPLLSFLADRNLSAIVLTHHHEDHAGSCGPLAARNRCPVFLRNPDRRFDEGLADLKPYRRLWWGEPEPYAPDPMPARIEADSTTLLPVPIPGHSATHTALLDEATNAVFTGDLYITGGATAVMSHENPFESIASLRRIADLEPRVMLTGHALLVESPAASLRRKADAIESAANRVLSLHASGARVGEIVRRVFPHGRANDLFLEWITSGEFSRSCFVRACLGWAPTPEQRAAM